MNNLNSTLIEGTVIKNPVFNNEKTSFLFELGSYSFKSKQRVSATYIDIKCNIPKFFSKIIESKNLRIVGKLINDDSGKIILEAEHIEFKL